MGLDMYLTKKTYVDAGYEHRKVKGTVKITVDGEVLPIQFKRISEISETVGYWRKANQIHRWFVENVQKGEDDCGEYEVGFKELQRLADDCEMVMNNPKDAAKILPRASGFFFGCQEYGEYYIQEIKDTLEIIKPLLAEAKEHEGEKYLPEGIYYSSSW